MKKLIAVFLSVCFLLSFFGVYADEGNALDSSAYNNDTRSDNGSESGVDPEGPAKVTFEYNKDEQKVLDSIPEIGCKAAFVAELTTGKIVYEKNAHEKMYPASTTKILTALLVLENCELTDKAVVSQKALDLVPEGYSNANLMAGEEFTIYTLLQALLIPSANEAANVLAEHVSGSVEAFAELCNKRAEELGCEMLHFVNPNGVHSEDHYCTAYDLYLIAKECRKHDAFNEIVKTESFTVPATEVYKKSDRTYSNSNLLIIPSSQKYYYPFCTGIKTGFTTPAGQCLVSSSSYENVDLICVVLGGGTNSLGLSERFYDTIQLFEYVYNNYSYKTIAEENEVIVTVDVDKATKDTSSLDVVIDTEISSVLPKDIDRENIETVITIQNDIEAPIEQDQVLGEVTFKADGVNYTTYLIASHDVEKKPFWLYNVLVVLAVLFVLAAVIALSVFIKKRRKIKKQ